MTNSGQSTGLRVVTVSLACIAGGIVGAREVKFWRYKVLGSRQERAPKPREIFQSPLHILLAASPPKLYYFATLLRVCQQYRHLHRLQFRSRKHIVRLT